jgi:hypothetical protein
MFTDPSIKAASRQKKDRPRRVLSFTQWCQVNSFSPRTGFRILKRGEGPPLTQITGRRHGVREDHNELWQEARLSARLGKSIKRLNQELACATSWQDARDCADRFAEVVKGMPPQQRERLIEHFNDQLGERDLNDR